MKNFFIAIFFVILISPVSAENLCTLTSEKDQDVTITLNYPGSGYGFGTLNYKKVPSFLFEVGISNGYGTQYYVLRTYSPDALNMYTKKNHSERFKNTEVISSGRFVNFVGNQLARVTSKKESIIIDIKKENGIDMLTSMEDLHPINIKMIVKTINVAKMTLFSRSLIASL